MDSQDGGPREHRRRAGAPAPTHGEDYVAQRWVAKPRLQIDGTPVWTDLRVWAYRGEIFQLSGRASRRPDRLDLARPGGWLPTYAAI